MIDCVRADYQHQFGIRQSDSETEFQTQTVGLKQSDSYYHQTDSTNP